MAFASTVPITFPNLGVIALWNGSETLVGAGGSYSGLDMINLAGISSLEKIYIVVEAVSASGTPTFDIFWKAATEVDGEFDIEVEFWTGVTTSTTDTIYTYFATRDGNVVVQGGAGAETKFIFDAPYLGFGLNNNGVGGEDITFTLTALGEVR